MVPLGGTDEVHGDISLYVSLLGSSFYSRFHFWIISTNPIYNIPQSFFLYFSPAPAFSPLTSVLNRACAYISSKSISQMYTEAQPDCVCV